MSLESLLSENSYPGRGIVAGMSLDGKYAVCAYFIMGRSENSRNRIFVEVPEDNGIETRPFDVKKLSDPSLIIYHPVRVDGPTTIVTNGDQTDTIRDLGDFRKALMTREFEPDEPNFTPRISAMLYDDGSFELAILKKKDGGCLREFFAYEGVLQGKGYFISTYQGDGNPLPSFAGEPIAIDWPPWTCASASAGLITLPQSWTLRIFVTCALHMARSTSTSTKVAPKE